MGRIWLQALLLVALFFGMYHTLRQVDWVNLLEIRETADKTEKKLGDMLWSMFRKSDREVKDKLVTHSLDSILVKLCDYNDIPEENIRLHVLEKDEVNAFALPDGHLVIYTGLIAACESPEELAGVMAHELAHIELDHVMKKLVKEIGLSVLVSMTTGSGGGEIAKEVARTLSSSAFDRQQEKEADIAAVDYMAAADIDPEPFGEFLYRLGGKSSRMGEYLSWISTHPDSRERGEYVISYAEEKTYEAGPVLGIGTWSRIREQLTAGIPASRSSQ
ncbi:MAG: peptidase M48 [Cytophagaceae bacterium SCN 52-12]|nr:MAG: peptidase M48 [Cytophagaceae bacterium SCN 52-12]